MRKPNDISQPPQAPQFQLGATSSDAEMAKEIADSHIGGPGEIVQRLGRQFELPRNDNPDAEPAVPDRNAPHTNPGTF